MTGKTKRRRTTTLSISVPHDIAQAIRNTAKQAGVSLSQLLSNVFAEMAKGAYVHSGQVAPEIAMLMAFATEHIGRVHSGEDAGEMTLYMTRNGLVWKHADIEVCKLPVSAQALPLVFEAYKAFAAQYCDSDNVAEPSNELQSQVANILDIRQHKTEREGAE